MIYWNGLDLLRIYIRGIVGLCYCRVWSAKNTHYRLIDIYRFLLRNGSNLARTDKTPETRKTQQDDSLVGLEDIYDAMIEQIKGQGGYKSAHGMGTLMWISYAEEPLIPGELCYALAAESGSTDFNVSNIPCQKAY